MKFYILKNSYAYLIFNVQFRSFIYLSGMAISFMQRKTRPFLFYIPFTVYFSIYIIALFLLWLLVNKQAHLPESSFTAIITLLLKVTFATAAFFLLFSFITTLIPFVYIWLVKKRGKLVCNFGLTENNPSANGIPQMALSIAPVVKPLFGFLKFRLRYNHENFSPKFQPISQSGFSIFQKKYSAVFSWQLPEIREYAVQEGWIYFEDLFQFFSFALSLPLQEQFNYPPGQKNIPPVSIPANKTDEDNHRVDELKKVEGEYLNFKHFEGQDDIRRIAWPVYARSRELVVRIPETLDTYASQVYVYTSCYSGFPGENNSPVGKHFLNWYKTIIWNLIKDIQEKGFRLTMITDQHPHPDDPQELTELQSLIITQEWQLALSLTDFVHVQNASAIIISSLCPVEQVQDLMYRRKETTLFILVKLSTVIRRNHLLHLLSWLFIQQEKNEIEKARTAWTLSLNRLAILDNEKKLQTLFQQNSKTLIL